MQQLYECSVMELWFDRDSSYQFQYCSNFLLVVSISFQNMKYFSVSADSLPFHLFISLTSFPSLITIIPLIKQLTCLLQKLINLLSSCSLLIFLFPSFYLLFLWSSPHVSSCLISTLSSFHIFLSCLHPSC